MVLKNKAMIGDGLSHVAFGACAIAACLNWAPLLVSIPVVVISAFIILEVLFKHVILMVLVCRYWKAMYFSYFILFSPFVLSEFIITNKGA